MIITTINGREKNERLIFTTLSFPTNQINNHLLANSSFKRIASYIRKRTINADKPTKHPAYKQFI